jgi:ribosome-binding ATPase YchF (GTP1/OBG family)
MKIGIVGKPSSGKSTFFSGATLVDVPIAAHPFTTIKPNLGTSHVSKECVCKELDVVCNPKNSLCVNGERMVPVTLIDVAGLVPDAHKGKGLGNQFMGDLMEASGLIHIVDISGTTDAEGKPTSGYDPEEDVIFLEKEIGYWIEGLLEKQWATIERKQKGGMPLWQAVYEQLSGLGISEEKTRQIVGDGFEDKLELATRIRETNKPLVLAGNKIDLKDSGENYNRLKGKYDITPVCADAELALRKAARSGIINYAPGSSDFQIVKDLPEKQKRALEFIRNNVLVKYRSTGVQPILDELVFKRLGYIVVYPVEDENKLADKQGNVLPDAYLMAQGSTALDLAYCVHSDIGGRFIGAIDARTKKKIGKDYILNDGDVVKILTKS